MMSEYKYQPSLPAQEGLIISGTPTRDVMLPGITGGMATRVPSQTVGTQGSLGHSATCVQPLPAQPGDEPAEKLDPPSPTVPSMAQDRRPARRQHSKQTGPEQTGAPTAAAAGGDVTAEQSAATTSPLSVIPDASAGAGAGRGELHQLFPLSKRQLSWTLPLGCLRSLTRSPYQFWRRLWPRGVAETAVKVKRKATDTPSSSVVQGSKRLRSQGTWEAAFQKAEKDNLLGILYIILPSVGLYALTLYPATADCPAASLRPIYPVSPAVGS